MTQPSAVAAPPLKTSDAPPRSAAAASIPVQLDLTKCLGFGQCCFAAPDVFWMKGQESVEFRAAITLDRYEAVQAAAAACPVQAITLGRGPESATEAPYATRLGPRVVVIGASLAGLRAAEAVRLRSPDARLIIIDAEGAPAYDRPPLSKGLLSGALDVEDVQLPHHPALDAEWKVGLKAVRLERDINSVVLSNGEPVRYDRLIIASGAHARPWPDPEVSRLRGLITLRSLEDARALREAMLQKPARVCIIGAGFIGTEVASTCRSLGLDVTVLERAPIPLLRALGRPVGEAFAKTLIEHGVDLRLGAEVKQIHASADGTGVAGVELSDGAMVDCQIVVVALGAVRNTAWLDGANLMIDERGVATDVYCRVLAADGVPLKDVFAAGDVTTWPSALFDDERMAVEHWSNALEQGDCAGRNAISTDELEEHDYLPTFWSSQFGLNIKSAGLPGVADSFQVVQGSLDSGRFAGLYGRNGRTVAVVTVDHGRYMPFYTKLIRERAPFPQALVAAEGPLHLNR